MYSPPIMTEKDASQKLKTRLQDVENVLLVRSRRSYFENGSATLMANALQGKDITEFFDFSPNPKMEDVERGVQSLKLSERDAIVAIGGGSVIDMAKLIRHFSHQPQTPLYALPTTAGTGAEVTPFAVCYIEGKKNSIGDKAMSPTEYFLVPTLTEHNPPYLTACTGFDALAQAIEAYWNLHATTQSDLYAMDAIRLIFPVLEDVVTGHADTPEHREQLLTGANLAGKAISITRTTVPHALSYTLTSKYGYPHGHAVALTFPFYLNYYVNATPEDYQGKDFTAYKVKCNHLLSALRIKNSAICQKTFGIFLKNIGLNFDKFRDFDDEVVAAGLNLERAKNSPCRLTHEIIIRSIKSIRN